MTMVADPRTQRFLTSALYTRAARSTGLLRQLERRFSDSLNALDLEFIELQKGNTEPLGGTGGMSQGSCDLVLRRADVVLALPLSDEPNVSVLGVMAVRNPVPCVLSMWPFAIAGTLHVAPGVPLQEHIRDARYRFMPITDASVSCHLNNAFDFAAPFIMVARDAIDTAGVMPSTATTDRETAGSDDTTPTGGKPSRNTLDAAQAETLVTSDEEAVGADELRIAGILESSRLFRNATQSVLVGACQRLVESQAAYPDYGIRLAAVDRGEVLYEAHERGGSLFIIEQGIVQVSSRTAGRGPHSPRYYGPGDVIGEMAILGGDGLYGSTAHAVTSVSVLAISQAALMVLVKRFPKATTALLNLVNERVRQHGWRL